MSDQEDERYVRDAVTEGTLEDLISTIAALCRVLASVLAIAMLMNLLRIFRVLKRLPVARRWRLAARTCLSACRIGYFVQRRVKNDAQLADTE